MPSTITKTILGGAAVVMLAGTLSLLHAARVHGAVRFNPDAVSDEMGGHMAMTTLRPLRPGDREKADAIVVAARKVAEQYLDYRKALADGYKIFLPEAPQKVYHFTRDGHAIGAAFSFDASKPTSLLYEKTATGYKLVGVMYTDRYGAPVDELDARVPLSIAQWHVHTNLCMPPKAEHIDWDSPNAKFGLKGSITSEAACTAVGGKFYPHLFGWMVHVYPFETDNAKVWGAGMDDDHMEHDAMPGMKMGSGEKM